MRNPFRRRDVTGTTPCGEDDCDVCYPIRPPRFIERVLKWLERRWPLYYRHSVERIRALYEQSSRDLAAFHGQELEKEHRRVDDLVERLTLLTFRRDGRQYSFTFAFDPVVVSHYTDPRAFEVLADAMGRRLSHAIRTAKFVQDAEDPADSRRPRQPRLGTSDFFAGSGLTPPVPP